MAKPRSLALFLVLAFATSGFSQDKPNAVAKPELPPRINTQWDKAVNKIEQSRKKYLDDSEKALDEFARQVARLDPNCDARALCEKLKAVAMPAEADVALPVLGKDILVAPNGHKYKLFEDNLSWHDAKKKCEDEGGYLWVIDTQAEHAFIWTALAQVRKPGNDSFWLGGIKNEKGVWEWIVPKGSQLPNIGWEAHFPVADGGKDVLAINGGGRLINERPHNHPGMRFVCEWDK